jgi:DNA-binding NtrC family response regulator
LKRKIDGIAPDAQKLLLRYHWPGNIRELENALERAVLLTEGPIISVDDLRLGETITVGGDPSTTPVVRVPPTGVALEDIERQALMEALRMCNWIQRDAAELLHISPRVINYKIKTLGIELPRHRRLAAGE